LLLQFVPLLILCGCAMSLAGNVLVLPGEYSHWINMQAIVEELVKRNHSITVLVSTASPTVDYRKNENFNFEVLQVPFSKSEMHSVSQEMINFWMHKTQNASLLDTFFKVKEVMEKATVLQKEICDAMLRNSKLQDKLRRTQYEGLLVDPMVQCGDLLAQVLGIPLIFSLRFSFGYTIERFCGQLPTPASYVPASPVQFSDRMSFVQRLKNVLLYTFHSLLFYIHTTVNWDHYYSEILGKPTTACEVMGKADLWLIRTNWDFDYPRPLLPNFQFVGGLHCKPSNPLPADMEEFAQSSGDDGIVVFSLGTMVEDLTREKANMIASALGQIPQKVIWGYSGMKPETLAPNTRVYDWIPQNDLLGHPKTRAFITHGGTNGLYEAIYHGVPMVGIPMFADQPDNLFHMVTKGAAVMLDLYNMQSKDLVDAVNIVIKDPSYKESAMRLSRFYHDQPEKPLDRAIFWIEFVMRNKGAKHLRVQAHNLTWYQYYCLDVFAVLLAAALLAASILLKTCRGCFKRCCRSLKTKSKKE
uniref:UDP-glucuronosyltransferase n=1 Tax=Scleropages formosus TaxID=113540 RepID=A0A8D0CJ73_SCLFO